MAATALVPHLFMTAPKAEEAVQFFKAAFGAQELKRCLLPQKKADHPPLFCAELKIGSSTIMVCDQSEDSGSYGGSQTFCLETEDLEGMVSKAVKAGATLEGDITQDIGVCCGARSGKLKDPYGNVWAICNSITQCC